MPEPPLIAPAGELDLTSVGTFRTQVEKLTAEANDGLVIDLAEVSFIDSIGLGALIEIHARCRAEKRDLGVVAPEGSVAARLLARTGFARRLRIFQSRAEALRGLRGDG